VSFEICDRHGRVRCSECAEIEDLRTRLAEAEAALKLRTAELAACKSACQGEMESADEYKAERDECRRLLREVVEALDNQKSLLGATIRDEWRDEAAKAGGV